MRIYSLSSPFRHATFFNKVCAHFLQARSKRFDLLLLRRSNFLLVLFEKLVEQHRVHGS